MGTSVIRAGDGATATGSRGFAGLRQTHSYRFRHPEHLILRQLHAMRLACMLLHGRHEALIVVLANGLAAIAFYLLGCRRLIRDELGVPPSRETRALHEELLASL